MLSSRTVANDGGPTSPRPSPIQGLDQHPHSSAAQDLPGSTSLASPSSLCRRDSHFNVDTGSPKNRSPLRHSLSYTDTSELDFSSQRLRRRSQDPWNDRPSSVIGMPYTGDKRHGGHPDSPKGGRYWWSRTATHGPDDLTLPQEPISSEARSASVTPKNASSNGGSRFAFFSSSSQATPPNDEELINLDIESALFPGGFPDEKSAFSPAAFKNLQMTAIGLLNKYQAAYQQRTTETRDLQADREAQAEEKEELETRVFHLKMQLEEMARKASEREDTMQSILQELAQEKRARAEEQQLMREKRVPPSEFSAVSEDLGVEDDLKRRSWRKSGGTTKSDLSLDTDEESVDSVSIFSRSRSPTIATSMSEATCSPIEPTTPQAKTTMPPPPRPQRSAPPQMTTFQKLFKGISGGEASKDGAATNGCLNCQGQDASVAWDTVSLLRDENKGLKQRVGELETAVESALDAVHGLGL